LNKANVSTT